MTTDSSSSQHRGPQRRLLVLMRHAKSDWSDEGLSDHDRPLNERGQRDAPRMGQWLVDVDAVPDTVLSSSAERTRETVSLMLPMWDNEPTVCFNESLYLSSPETILNTVCSDGGDARVLMVVAHNPGTGHLVSELADQGIDMVTASIAIFEMTLSDWSELSSETPRRLIHFMRPKAL